MPSRQIIIEVIIPPPTSRVDLAWSVWVAQMKAGQPSTLTAEQRSMMVTYRLSRLVAQLRREDGCERALAKDYGDAS